LVWASDVGKGLLDHCLVLYGREKKVVDVGHDLLAAVERKLVNR
jgi:hypothetical protein